MGTIALNFAVNHKDFFIGAGVGFALNHVPWVTGLAFHQAMKWPWLRGKVIGNPEQAHALIAEIKKEIDTDIDAEVAAAVAEKK